MDKILDFVSEQYFVLNSVMFGLNSHLKCLNLFCNILIRNEPHPPRGLIRNSLLMFWWYFLLKLLKCLYLENGNVSTIVIPIEGVK
jgi:hypothetical protein